MAPREGPIATFASGAADAIIGLSDAVREGGPVSGQSRGLSEMEHRLRILGAVLAVIGVIAVAGGAYGYTRVQGGANALQGFSAAQDVRLTYDQDGQLVDRGSVEGGAAILALLADEWGWPVNRGELDPADPVVDTGTEYMYQMATIAYHTLHGAQSVTLTEPAQWDGDGVEGIAADATVYSPASLPEGTWDPAVEGTDADAIFEPGTYVVPVNGRYWTAFDRTHPLDGKARELAWSGTVHGLFAELGVGATTASSLEMGLAIVAMLAAFGVVFIIAGGGLVWAAWPARVKVAQASGLKEPMPA